MAATAAATLTLSAAAIVYDTLAFFLFMVFILRFSGAAWITFFLAVLTHPHPLGELINCGIRVKVKAA